MTYELVSIYRVLIQRAQVRIQRAQVRGPGFSPIRFVLLFEAMSVDRARLSADEFLESLEGCFEIVEVRPLQPFRVPVPQMAAMA